MVEFAEREKKKENHTGIPTQLKERMEQRTGLSFDDVRVHYNSDLPERLGALAYTQGNQVEIGPGQERHLSHELGHVVQQKLGLVRANAMHPRGVAMNTDEGLERQADEIGAGKRIENTPAGNAGTGIIQRYRIIKDYIFAQAPSPEKESMVMVKNGEPASVYFEETVNEVESLKSLGIKKTSNFISFPNSKEPNKERKFFRFAQSQIENIGNGKGAQPTRKFKIEKGRAKGLIEQQNDILGELLNCATELQGNELSDGVKELSHKVFEITNKYITRYQNKKDKKEHIAMSSLGYDIFLDMCALQNIAKQWESISLIDRDYALQIVIEDLTYRKKQVEEELNLVQYKPILPTECGRSSDVRYMLSGSPNARLEINKSNWQDSNRESVILWANHYATRILLPGLIGSQDCLFIEDAVGKSSTGNELANAHWAAHIYGLREDESLSWQKDIQQNEWEPLNCRFNGLSAELRARFLGEKGIREGSKFVMDYYEGTRQYGNLVIIVLNNMLFYLFQPKLKPYMRHFAMDVAKTLADKFVLQALSLENAKDLTLINDSIHSYAVGKGYYTIESMD